MSVRVNSQGAESCIIISYHISHYTCLGHIYVARCLSWAAFDIYRQSVL